MNYQKYLLILIVLAVWSCQNEPIIATQNNKNTLFSALSMAQSGVEFVNVVKETEDNNHLVWESIYNGAGVGVGDLNNDGLLDIYFCGNMSPDKLYLNKGGMKFEDVTSKANIVELDWSSGVVMADVNNDGLLDIYVSKMSWEKDNVSPQKRQNRLYINQGNMHFEEAAEQYQIADRGHTTQSSFFDYNKDGLLDLYVMNAPSHRYDQKLDYMKDNKISYDFKDHLYINRGNHFDDVTIEAIGDQDHAYGLGLSTVDIDQDGWVDIYVANDFEKPDLMLINDKKGGFDNLMAKKLKHISYSSMGMDIADINNDGRSDIFVLEMQSSDHVRSKTNMPSMNIRQFWKNVGNGYHFQYMSNMLQLNNGTGKYSEIAQLAGVASTDWSWSVLLADMDNDSYRDVMITNGINRNIKDNDFNLMMKKSRKSGSFLDLAMKTKVEKIKNFAFRNDGDKLHFQQISEEWGFDHNGFTFGSAYGDLDNDGDLDIVINNSNEPAIIYENKKASNNHWLRIKATDHGKIVMNTIANLYYGDQVQVSELHNVRGYQSCSELAMHFGLGSITNVDSMVVRFPKGRSIVIRSPDVDSLYILDIATSNKIIETPSLPRCKPMLRHITKSSGLAYLHK